MRILFEQSLEPFCNRRKRTNELSQHLLGWLKLVAFTSTETYGNPAIGIQAYDEPEEITGDTFSEFEQQFKVISNYFIENNDGPGYSDSILNAAWGVFVDGGTDATTGLSRPSPLLIQQAHLQITTQKL